MATINGIISIIKEKYQYLTPDIQTIVKNTVPMTGLCLRTANSNTAPCIYIDNLLNASVSEEDAVEHIMHIYHSAKLNIDSSLFYDKDYLLSHMYLGLQRFDNKCNYITRQSDWDNIIEYIYVRGKTDSEYYQAKITEQLLNTANIPVELAWHFAEQNTYSEIKIESMEQVISHLTDYDEFDSLPCTNMWVASNPHRINGAAVVKNLEYIKEWAIRHGYSDDGLILIFSSIHEAILLPAQSICLEEITEMINAVNTECVDAAERLATKAYLIKF